MTTLKYLSAYPPELLEGVHRLIGEGRLGRVLDVLSDQAGVQVYSGNFLDGSLQGASGRPYHAHAAICIEPQAYPDAMNQPALPDITLQPGAVYRNRIRYRFSKDTP